MKRKFFENKKEKKYGNDSVDDVIDKHLLDYEENALSIKNENFNFKDFVLTSILSEAEGDKSDLDQMINIKDFAKDVIRLHDNYDSLIDVTDIILKRAYSFLEKNYGKDVLKDFENCLKDDFQIEIGRTKTDMETDFTAPYAKRSGGGSQ